MKKLFKIFALLMVALLCLTACSKADAPKEETVSTGDAYMDELIAAAKEEGELVIYGSCEDTYTAAATKKFEELYGIKTSFERLAGGEVQAKIEEENGNPSADVWFGGTSDPQAICAKQGLLMAYEAKNASHITNPMYRDANGYWYGIYTSILGLFYNTEELDRLGLDYPADWDDLLDPKYEGLIWFSNPNTASTAKLTINTFVQMWGEEKAMEYFVALDKNVAQYTKSGSGPVKSVGSGECTVGIGFTCDAVYQMDLGYDNIGLAVPPSGTSAEVGAVSIFEGCKHPNAAKLWVEFALTPDCVERAAEVGCYEFLVIDNAKQPEQLAAFDLDLDVCIDYDFEDAKENTNKYIEDFFTAIGDNADDRFKTE